MHINKQFSRVKLMGKSIVWNAYLHKFPYTLSIDFKVVRLKMASETSFAHPN